MAYRYKKKTEKKEVKRPHSYFKPEYVQQGFSLALAGFTNKMMAEFFKVSIPVIEYWIVNDKGGFGEAVRAGRVQADAKVAESLFKRAVGYSYVETVKITDSNGEVIKMEEITKQMAPDTNACLKWLQNRQRGIWTDARKQIDVNYKGIHVDISLVQDALGDKGMFSLEELQAELKESVIELSEVQESD